MTIHDLIDRMTFAERAGLTPSGWEMTRVGIAQVARAIMDDTAFGPPPVLAQLVQAIMRDEPLPKDLTLLGLPVTEVPETAAPLEPVRLLTSPDRIVPGLPSELALKAFVAVLTAALHDQEERGDPATPPWEVVEYDFPGKYGMAVRIGANVFLVDVRLAKP
jgi:hypothetical protein